MIFRLEIHDKFVPDLVAVVNHDRAAVGRQPLATTAEAIQEFSARLQALISSSVTRGRKAQAAAAPDWASKTDAQRDVARQQIAAAARSETAADVAVLVNPEPRVR